MPSKKSNKSKEQIASDIVRVQKANREKSLVKLMFPLIEGMSSIYDAQTALQALSGFIRNELDLKNSEFVLQDLKIDLSKEKDSEVKTALVNLIDMLAIEKAKDLSDLLQRFGNILAQHSANKFMKNPMSDIALKDIIAE